MKKVLTFPWNKHEKAIIIIGFVTTIIVFIINKKTWWEIIVTWFISTLIAVWINQYRMRQIIKKNYTKWKKVKWRITKATKTESIKQHLIRWYRYNIEWEIKNHKETFQWIVYNYGQDRRYINKKNNKKIFNHIENIESSKDKVIILYNPKRIEEFTLIIN